MNKLKDLARSHPLTSYFVTTFFISWSLWFTFFYLLDVNPLISDLGGVIGVFGPSIAALIIGNLRSTGTTSPQTVKAVLSFLLSLVVITCVMVLMATVKGASPDNYPMFILFIMLFALTPAIIISRTYSKTESVRSFMKSLLDEKTNIIHYAIAIFLFPIFLGAGWFVSKWIGFHHPDFYTRELYGLTYTAGVPLLFIHTFFMSGGMTEEPGWRGFALRHLLSKNSPLVATIVLWLFWTVWHAPIKFGPMATHAPIDVFIEWFSLLPISFIFTWLYLRSGGNLLCAVLLHTSMNTSSAFIPITTGSNILLGLIFLAVFLSGKMWRNEKTVSAHEVSETVHTC